MARNTKRTGSALFGKRCEPRRIVGVQNFGEHEAVEVLMFPCLLKPSNTDNSHDIHDSIKQTFSETFVRNSLHDTMLRTHIGPVLFSLFAIFSTSYSCINNHTVHAMSPLPYEAPMVDCSPSEGTVVPQKFLVKLHIGHSLDDHSEAVGTHMETYIHKIFSGIWPERIAYGCTGVDDELLARIRADYGVMEVHCAVLVKARW